MTISLDDGFRAKMAVAVQVVLGKLPDKDADRTEILEQAVGIIFVDGDAWEPAKRQLGQLVAQSPVCYGANRTSRWWRIVTTYLTLEESVNAYLLRFPDRLTDGQWWSVESYLVNVRKFDPNIVRAAMEARFLRRTGTKKPKPARTGFVQ